MAIFRDFRRLARFQEEDVATLHLSVLMEEQSEKGAWELLLDRHAELETEIREAITAVLGPQFTASQLFYARGSIELWIAIAAGAYAGYVGISRYKNFFDSMTLLVRQVRGIVDRFFQRHQWPATAVVGTWIPGSQVIPSYWDRAVAPDPRLSGLMPLLWYVLLSHATLLAFVLWRFLRIP